MECRRCSLTSLYSWFHLLRYHPFIRGLRIKFTSHQFGFGLNFQTIRRSEIYRTLLSLGQNDSISGLFSWPLLDLRSFYRRCHNCFRGRMKYLWNESETGIAEITEIAQGSSIHPTTCFFNTARLDSICDASVSSLDICFPLRLQRCT